VRVLIQLDQPAAAADDLTDRGRLDNQQPGVMIDAIIVVIGPLAVFQGSPVRTGQQFRR
jgi:hypothetical protein